MKFLILVVMDNIHSDCVEGVVENIISNLNIYNINDIPLSEYLFEMENANENMIQSLFNLCEEYINSIPIKTIFTGDFNTHKFKHQFLSVLFTKRTLFSKKKYQLLNYRFQKAADQTDELDEYMEGHPLNCDDKFTYLSRIFDISSDELKSLYNKLHSKYKELTFIIWCLVYVTFNKNLTEFDSTNPLYNLNFILDDSKSNMMLHLEFVENYLTTTFKSDKNTFVLFLLYILNTLKTKSVSDLDRVIYLDCLKFFQAEDVIGEMQVQPYCVGSIDGNFLYSILSKYNQILNGEDIFNGKCPQMIRTIIHNFPYYKRKKLLIVNDMVIAKDKEPDEIYIKTDNFKIGYSKCFIYLINSVSFDSDYIKFVNIIKSAPLSDEEVKSLSYLYFDSINVFLSTIEYALLRYRFNIEGPNLNSVYNLTCKLNILNFNLGADRFLLNDKSKLENYLNLLTESLTQQSTQNWQIYTKYITNMITKLNDNLKVNNDQQTTLDSILSLTTLSSSFMILSSYNENMNTKDTSILHTYALLLYNSDANVYIKNALLQLLKSVNISLSNNYTMIPISSSYSEIELYNYNTSHFNLNDFKIETIHDDYNLLLDYIRHFKSKKDILNEIV